MEDHYKYGTPDWLKLITEIEKFTRMKILHQQSLMGDRYEECIRESRKSRLSPEDFYFVASRVRFDYEKAHEIAADDQLLRIYNLK